MQIYVCVKHVPDSAATIAIQAPNRIDENITFLLNPYDENAVEEAVRLKAGIADAEVVAVSLGKEGAVATLRSALAMGADRGILIATDFPTDSILTARALAAGILSDGSADIIFTGRQSIDGEGFQTMFRLGAALHAPVATNVVSFAMNAGSATVECEMEAGGRQVIEMPLPCVIGAGKALNRPRYPTLPEIIKARKKPIRTIPMEELKLDPPSSRMEILELRPAVEKRQGRILTGDPEEAVRDLVHLLRREAKVI